jgi:hypothetical protein
MYIFNCLFKAVAAFVQENTMEQLILMKDTTMLLFLKGTL